VNEKDAREIIPRYKQLFDRRAEIEMEPVYRMAQGYLEGLAQGRKEAEGIFRTGFRLAHQLHEKAENQDHIITATEIEFRKELAKWEAKPEPPLCVHVNEDPDICPCRGDCYCHMTTCKDKCDGGG